MSRSRPEELIGLNYPVFLGSLGSPAVALDWLTHTSDSNSCVPPGGKTPHPFVDHVGMGRP